MSDELSVFKTVDLPGGTLIPFPSIPGERLRILYGRVWLTEEGDLNDAFLGQGEEISLQGRGLAVLEAINPARIEWLKPANTFASGRFLRKWSEATRDWFGFKRTHAQCPAS